MLAVMFEKVVNIGAVSIDKMADNLHACTLATFGNNFVSLAGDVVVKSQQILKEKPGRIDEHEWWRVITNASLKFDNADWQSRVKDAVTAVALGKSTPEAALADLEKVHTLTDERDEWKETSTIVSALSTEVKQVKRDNAKKINAGDGAAGVFNKDKCVPCPNQKEAWKHINAGQTRRPPDVSTDGPLFECCGKRHKCKYNGHQGMYMKAPHDFDARFAKKQKRRDKRDRAKAAAEKGGEDEPEKETPHPQTQSATKRRLAVKDAVLSSLTTATPLSVEDAEKFAEQNAKDGLDQAKRVGQNRDGSRPKELTDLLVLPFVFLIRMTLLFL